ncbi:MAG: EAL domain-containing protein [Shinella sp.]|nr:EAL domain-containing protein [Shinella sp.]
MRRLRIIVAAVALALVEAIIPIAVMLYFSWTLAVKNEQNRLALFADRAITRANISFSEAANTLRIIAASKFQPCSADHIAQMRILTINSPVVEEIGYFENRMLKCTSWGETDERVAQAHVDYTTAGGVDVTVRIRPAVSQGNHMMGLQYGPYNVLVNPVRFVDVVVDKSIRLAIFGQNDALIGELNAPDPTLTASILAEPRNGIDDENLFAVAQQDGWTAIAVEPRAEILVNLKREQMLLLPAGAFIAAFIIGIVIWFSRKRLSPLGELTIAVQKREFVVHYQPIVELKTGICVGAEALVRWRRPDGSLVRPDLFIPLAEESGLIMAITDQVLDVVIAELGKLLVDDRSLHIAINLCAADIKSGRILPVIQKALASTGIRTEQIWLEATERGFMDISAARETIEQARASGHSVAIDDFGTGYSSLQYLQELPLDALKIDKSFIDVIGKDTATSSVTSHIIDMAKSLKLFTVAEGIESQDQADYLNARDVDFGQGWLFSKALPASEFVAFYRRSKEKFGAGPAVIQRAIA